MKNIFKSFCICFSTFSIIPTKNVSWDEDAMKYVFCFFPFIGLIIGLIEYFWFTFSHNQNISSILYSSIATIIPIIITGGIHIDGLIDTFDAIFCYGDVDKRLEVLKDSRVGAFGVIYTLIYFVITFGVFESLYYKDISMILFISVYTLSRIVSGLITINFKEAKDSGLQKAFRCDENVKPVSFILGIYTFILFSIIDNLVIFRTMAIVAIIFYTWFNRFSKKLIGGLAGDLIGFSLTIFELLLLITLLII